MRAYGIPEKLTNFGKAFYNNFKCAVIHQGETSEWFDIKTGVKEGCNMSGFLFLMVVNWVMRRTIRNGETGIRWKFTSKLDDLDFADDLAMIASTKQHIQLKTDRLCRVAQRVGLKVNSQKTKVMRIISRNDDRIHINGEEVEDVNKFVYLGVTLTKSGGGMGDMENRISKGRNAYTQLIKIWNSNKIKRTTKLKLCKSLVLSVLLYGSETWKMTKGDERKLNTFQMKYLRRIMKIKCQEHISNEELLIRTKMKKLSTIIMKRRWKFIGHTLRGERASICNTALTWAPEVKRKKGRPKTTWQRTVEKERNLAGWRSWAEARAAAVDRSEWRRLVEVLCNTRHFEDR